jgi:Na+/phosphate symporter
MNNFIELQRLVKEQKDAIESLENLIERAKHFMGMCEEKKHIQTAVAVEVAIDKLYSARDSLVLETRNAILKQAEKTTYEEILDASRE